MIRKPLYVILPGIVLLALFSAASPLPAQSTGAVLRGKVKELGGKALEGVRVEARRIEQKPADKQSSSRASNRASSRSETVQKYETLTDSKGEFAFSDLVAGNYSLTFEKSGFVTISTWQMEVRAGETVQIGRTVELPRERQTASSLIRGAVLNGEGFSFQNATVKLERIGGRKYKKETSSTEGGRFAFSVPSEKGTYRLTASAHGYDDAVKEIEVDASEVRDIVLTLEKKP